MFKQMFTEGLIPAELNEAGKPGKIEAKDWTRMMDLVLAGKDGAGVARTIKDKHKAIARFVAGNRLQHPEGDYNGIRWIDFEDFKDKAEELGADEAEIKKVYNDTKVPPKVFDKYQSLKNKNLDNRFVGVISKAVLAMGFDIKFIGKGGNATTNDGIYAMNNGLKWTIGYKAEIDTGKEKLSFIFDAITDERIDAKPTYYVLDELRNLDTGESEVGWGVMGQREFLVWLKEELSQYK